MPDRGPGFDLEAAHRYFSVTCFNDTWQLIDKLDRTAEDDDEMVRLALASTWHWTRRPDGSAQNLSIAYWLLSRVFALVREAGLAERYATTCLEVSQKGQVAPFFLGYAYEGLARAAALAGRPADVERYLALARSAAESVISVDERQMLLADLASIH